MMFFRAAVSLSFVGDARSPANMLHRPIHRLLSSTSASSGLRAPIIAAFAGSSRDGSVNTKLAKAAQRIAQTHGAETTFLDLSCYNLPLYNQDEESVNGLPDGAIQLKSDLAAADGWIVASPEYNGFVTPLLLNALTWCSRGDSPNQMYATFRGKAATVVSASPGAMGGMRALNPTRQVLQNLGVNVLPLSVAVGGAFQAFDDSGQLNDTKQKAMLESAVASLYYLSRDQANREAACKIIEAHTITVGAYGSVDVAK